jgi:hypothetical protein
MQSMVPSGEEEKKGQTYLILEGALVVPPEVV